VPVNKCVFRNNPECEQMCGFIVEKYKEIEELKEERGW
jgi:hypothetical protein